MQLYLAAAISLAAVGGASIAGSSYPHDKPGDIECESIPFFSGSLMVLVAIGYYTFAR
jgi:hypothetical protein